MPKLRTCESNHQQVAFYGSSRDELQSCLQPVTQQARPCLLSGVQALAAQATPAWHPESPAPAPETQQVRGEKARGQWARRNQNNLET